jgi:hypothetical protein
LPYSSSLFLLVLFEWIVIVIEVVIDPRQFKRLHAYDLILGATFGTGDHVALFHFI